MPSNRSQRRTAPARRALGVHRDAPLPEFHAPFRARDGAPGEARARGRTRRRARRGRVALFATCYGNRNEPRSSRTSSPCSSTTASRSRWRASERCCGMPKLELGDLEAVAKLEGDEHPRAGRAGRRRLRHRRAGAVLRPDVQAGTAAAVSGRPATCGKVARAHFRSVRIPDAASPRGHAAHRLQAAARQDRLPRALSPAGAEHRPQDARAAVSSCRAPGRDDRALLGPQRHLRASSASSATSR